MNSGPETTCANAMPDWVQDRYWGQAVWQWVGLVIVVPVGFLLMIYVYRLGSHQADKFVKTNLLRYCLNLGFAVVAMFVPLWTLHVIERHLTIRGGDFMKVHMMKIRTKDCLCRTPTKA